MIRIVLTELLFISAPLATANGRSDETEKSDIFENTYKKERKTRETKR